MWDYVNQKPVDNFAFFQFAGLTLFIISFAKPLEQALDGLWTNLWKMWITLCSGWRIKFLCHFSAANQQKRDVIFR